MTDKIPNLLLNPVMFILKRWVIFTFLDYFQKLCQCALISCAQFVTALAGFLALSCWPAEDNLLDLSLSNRQDTGTKLETLPAAESDTIWKTPLKNDDTPIIIFEIYGLCVFKRTGNISHLSSVTVTVLKEPGGLPKHRVLLKRLMNIQPSTPVKLNSTRDWMQTKQLERDCGCFSCVTSLNRAGMQISQESWHIALSLKSEKRSV